MIDPLQGCGVAILEDPATHIGVTGPIQSVNFRDADGNLIEVSN